MIASTSRFLILGQAPAGLFDSLDDAEMT